MSQAARAHFDSDVYDSQSDVVVVPLCFDHALETALCKRQPYSPNDLGRVRTLRLTSNSWRACRLKDAAGDLYFLRTMTRLQWLVFENVPLFDLDFLVNLPSLRGLYLSACEVEDIHAIGSCPQLHSFYAPHNSIADWSPLRGLPQLSSVVLAGNPLRSAQGLPRAWVDDSGAAQWEHQFMNEQLFPFAW